MEDPSERAPADANDIASWRGLRYAVKVSYFMTTPLGRSVPQNDWKSIRADTILKLLYGVSRSPFNPNNDPVEVDLLVQATGLGLLDVHYLLGTMEAGGLIEVTRDLHGKPTAVRLSERGRDWISFQLFRLAEASESSG
jgi:hypothetical protein